jgi:hypothetical protein
VALPVAPGAVARAERMPLKPGPAEEGAWTASGPDRIKVTVGEAPIYVWLKAR